LVPILCVAFLKLGVKSPSLTAASSVRGLEKERDREREREREREKEREREGEGQRDRVCKQVFPSCSFTSTCLSASQVLHAAM